MPRPDPALAIRGSWETPPTGDTATLIVQGKSRPDFQPTNFYGYPAAGFEVTPAVNVLSAPAGGVPAFEDRQELREGVPGRAGRHPGHPGNPGHGRRCHRG